MLFLGGLIMDVRVSVVRVFGIFAVHIRSNWYNLLSEIWHSIPARFARTMESLQQLENGVLLPVRIGMSHLVNSRKLFLSQAATEEAQEGRSSTRKKLLFQDVE